MADLGKIAATGESESVLLLVEDNPADARLLTHQFQENGFAGKLNWVQDGDLALDYLFRRGKYRDARRPDLVILDLNLPKVHGREVLRTMRRDPELSSIPVVVLTTSNREEDMLMTFGLGSSSYLTKPRDLAGFEYIADRLLKIELPRARARAVE